MNDRERHIIYSLEKMDEEYRKIKQEASLKYQLKNAFNIEKIKEKIEWKRIAVKCKLLNLEEIQAPSNNMEYKEYEGDKKIAIYTCITGGYDNLLEPFYIDEKCDYFIFTDQNIKSDVYEVLNIPENINKMNNNVLINRYIKFHPHELFEKEYDYSIYIDGNIQQISNLSAFVNNINNDIGISMHKHSIRNCIYEESKILKIYKKGNPEFIEKQVEKYKQEGFPTQYGMAEANVIVTDLKSDISKRIFEDWWKEFLASKSMRDQLSLPYILWRNNIEMNTLTTLGDNVYKNPKIRKINHVEVKK